MRGQRDYLGGLTRLHLLDSREEQRATWRQSLATLARAVSDQQGVPLEGFRPEALHAGVRAAFNANLIDDLEFLSPAAAAAALYELASALPDGFERRELGRRVLQHLRQGDASTFVSIATLLAQGSPKALSGQHIRARVALALDLPYGLGAPVDALALALISRLDLQREWLTEPSKGSLPSRRLAARLLERAAREAARQAAANDDTGVRIFGTQSVRAAWNRLLGDRESLVWRHIAVARGLLSAAVPSFGSEIERHLDPKLTPTEWRRASASLAGTIAASPTQAVERGRQLLEGPLTKLDRGVASAMILGLSRAAEAEPEAVEELLETLIRVGSVAAAESLVELKRERVGTDFGLWASKLARSHLREAAEAVRGHDDGKHALVQALESELRPRAEQSEPTLRDRLTGALDAFANDGPKSAYEAALEAVDAARATMCFLEECSSDDSYGRRWGFRALRELDTGLLETSTLHDLLILGTRSGDKNRSLAPLNELFGRLSKWLLERESAVVRDPSELEHLSIHMRQLRTMLHLVDADSSFVDDPSGEIRIRRLEMAHVLLHRVREDARTALRRTTTAAAARACDALVREEICEVSDVVIAAAHHLPDATDFITFAEASMMPEIEAATRSYATLKRVIVERATDSRGTTACLEALDALAHELPLASSRRVEALRSAIRSFTSNLLSIADARSLQELTDGEETNPISRLEPSARALALLVAGALRRLGVSDTDEPPQCGAAIRLIDFGIERALKGSPEPLDEAVSTALELLEDELPFGIAEVGRRVLEDLTTLPLQTPADATVPRHRSVAPQKAPLPPWLPPSRTLGGFYVLHALGSGSAASVFVVKRLEERSEVSAEKLALKVPEYDGSAALTLSESQFLQLFREEAGALLALPYHPNLVKFVTFDAGARPKPILVMELVEGPTLERAIAMGDLTMPRALALLDGVAAGLESMHNVGVGHLDLKPSNVILRRLHRDEVAIETPVLVDLGLAGRNVRPGCGTPNYAAPEIWGLLPQGHHPTPMSADVYAFGCLIYETLTGRLLFDAAAIGELQSSHIAHDGSTPSIAELALRPKLARLARLIGKTLRQDPRNRPTISAVRAELAHRAAELINLPWPIISSSSNDDTEPGMTLPPPIPPPRRNSSDLGNQ